MTRPVGNTAIRHWAYRLRLAVYGAYFGARYGWTARMLPLELHYAAECLERLVQIHREQLPPLLAGTLRQSAADLRNRANEKYSAIRSNAYNRRDWDTVK